VSLLNPQQITGPGWSGNYTQPDYRILAANLQPSTFASGANSLNLTWPIAPYVQPSYLNAGAASWQPEPLGPE
jgi:hypothetical protein